MLNPIFCQKLKKVLNLSGALSQQEESGKMQQPDRMFV
jgi:hypothetical protein